jgi:hypothetical protein
LIEAWASGISNAMTWDARIVGFQRSINFFLSISGRAAAVPTSLRTAVIFFNLHDGKACPIMSSPHFVCVLCNGITVNLVPSIDHVDMIFVDDYIWIGHIDIAPGWNVE